MVIEGRILTVNMPPIGERAHALRVLGNPQVYDRALWIAKRDNEASVPRTRRSMPFFHMPLLIQSACQSALWLLAPLLKSRSLPVDSPLLLLNSSSRPILLVLSHIGSHLCLVDVPAPWLVLISYCTLQTNIRLSTPIRPSNESSLLMGPALHDSLGHVRPHGNGDDHISLCRGSSTMGFLLGSKHTPGLDHQNFA